MSYNGQFGRLPLDCDGLAHFDTQHVAKANSHNLDFDEATLSKKSDHG